jgi:thiamine pyrophosphate-dependent acetolactate synthase large subunit-like protein
VDNENSFKVLENNYYGFEKSFIDELYNNTKFDYILFWEYYDCLIDIARDAVDNDRNLDVTMKITKSYQRILQEIIWHFDKNDCSVLDDFPDNYTDYIERLDAAVNSYFTGIFMKEDFFNLQR